MNVVYDPAFIDTLKKLDIRIRKSFKKKIVLFFTNSEEPQLNNHTLRNKWQSYRSIDVTSDYRALYKEVLVEDKVIAYFVAIGTHKELYK